MINENIKHILGTAKSNACIYILVLVIFMLMASSCSNSANPESSSSEESKGTVEKLEESSTAVTKMSSRETTANTTVSEKDDRGVKPTEQDTMNVNLYFVKEIPEERIADDSMDRYYLVRETHTIPKTVGVAKAALEELFKNEAKTEGAYVSIPKTQKVLGIDIRDNAAVVNLSEDYNLLSSRESDLERYTVYAMVNTLTEFPSISEVKFQIEGEDKGLGYLLEQEDTVNFERNLAIVMEPDIWIDRPANQSKVSRDAGKLNIQGTAIVFENTLHYKVEDSTGKVLVEDFITISKNEGMRGIFDFTINLPELNTDKIKLSLYGESGKDGSPTGLVTHELIVE